MAGSGCGWEKIILGMRPERKRVVSVELWTVEEGRVVLDLGSKGVEIDCCRMVLLLEVSAMRLVDVTAAMRLVEQRSTGLYFSAVTLSVSASASSAIGVVSAVANSEAGAEQVNVNAAFGGVNVFSFGFRSAPGAEVEWSSDRRAEKRLSL